MRSGTIRHHALSLVILRMCKIIDVHIHTCFDSVLLIEGAKISGVDFSLEGLEREMKKNNVQYAVSMGLKSKGRRLLSLDAETPMMNDGSNNNVVLVGGINPYKAEQPNISLVEKLLASRKVRGLKIYLGYFDRYAYDDVYKRFYELAAKYRVPVVFHTGDNYDKNAKVKYAHPLTIDEVAVDFRDTSFIISHIGNPWTIDAGEVIYKNDNVYGDLSGIFTGDKNALEDVDDRDLEDTIKMYRWVHNPSKFLYGSDWPVTPMKPYIGLIERILRESTSFSDYVYHLKRVFRLNAETLFNL